MGILASDPDSDFTNHVNFLDFVSSFRNCRDSQNLEILRKEESSERRDMKTLHMWKKRCKNIRLLLPPTSPRVPIWSSEGSGSLFKKYGWYSPGNSAQCMGQPGWEGSLGENGSMCIYG